MWGGLIGVSRVRCQAQGPGRVMDNPDLVERFPLDLLFASNQNFLNKKRISKSLQWVFCFYLQTM